MFDTNHGIPSANAIHLSKLWDGVVTTDTCNLARLLSSLVRDAVIEAVGEKLHNDGQDSEDELVHVYTQDCHNHMRHVCIGAVT